jgi:hypothetical protein
MAQSRSLVVHIRAPSRPAVVDDAGVADEHSPELAHPWLAALPGRVADAEKRSRMEVVVGSISLGCSSR